MGKVKFQHAVKNVKKTIAKKEIVQGTSRKLL